MQILPDTNYDCCEICGPLDSIKPTIRTAQGIVLNPDFDAIKQFTATSEEVTVGAGEQAELSIIVQAEENHMGDLVVSELMVSASNPDARLAMQITSRQNDKLFSNVQVLDRFVATNAQLCSNLPCCFLVQATQFLQIRVTNLEAIPVNYRIAARGRRLLAYGNPRLRQQLLAYYNQQRHTPYWLGIDRVQGTGVTDAPGGGIVIPAGGNGIAWMTVPGGGDFLAEGRPLAVVDGVTDPDNIFVEIKEGASGRSLMQEPLPLATFVAKLNADVTGLVDNEFRAASLRGCKLRQFFKRNQRIRIEIENRDGNPATVFLCFPGCMLYYDECGPYGRGMNKIRSLEPVIGPVLAPAPHCPPPGQGWEYGQPMTGQQVPVNGKVDQDQALNMGVTSGSGHQTTLRDFMQTQAGAYTKKTYNEENLRAHGYLNGGPQLPDGGR
jgi:hypothetical protein